MPRPRKTPDFAAAAKRFNVCERTCRRWHEQGADLDDLESVANLLLRQKTPKAEAIETLEHHLTDSENE